MAYVILLGEGFEIGGLYEQRLDELFWPLRRTGICWSWSS